MNKELTEVRYDDDGCKSVLSLPTELLVTIFSYLPTRDKVKIQYVSRRFKEVCETPSLWKEFVWPDYEPRHVRSIINVLNVCGERVGQIFFPAHVTPMKILEMVKCCKNVTHLSLPESCQLKLDHLEEVIHTMTHLHQLDIFTSNFIQSDVDQSGLQFYHRLLAIVASVKQLNLQINDGHPENAFVAIRLWAYQSNPLPSIINIFTEDHKRPTAMLLIFWMESSSKSPSFEISLYEIKRLPMNLFPSVPHIKFKFGAAATYPFINLSDHGILGLGHKRYTFYLSDYDHHGKVRYSVMPMYSNLGDKQHHLSSISSLLSISNINLSYLNIFPDDLSQLAVACPNLQRLDVRENINCLKSLQGLRAIVQMCEHLEGLNLVGIPALFVESCLLLWELLLNLKELTHLAVGLCVLQPYEVSKLKSCYSLQALEIHNDDCTECKSSSELSFSHFPSLLYCRMCSFLYFRLMDALTSCNQLKYLHIDCLYNGNKYIDKLPLSLTNCNLQQLYIKSSFDVTDEYMNVLSAHGGLECVILSVQSITINAITTLINNSPNLILLRVSMTVPWLREDHPNVVGYVAMHNIDYTDKVRKLFSYRKLFAVGSFEVCYDRRCLVYTKSDTALFNTDLNSLWASKESSSAFIARLAEPLSYHNE